MSILGGADGPTSIFLAGKLQAGWLNLSGLLFVVLLLLPNILYAFRFRGKGQAGEKGAAHILEQVGRYASIFLMVLPVGRAELGFWSLGAFLAYGIGNAVLLLSYWLVWAAYFHRQSPRKAMALAVIPAVMFELSGITMGHPLLCVSAAVFAVSHIFLTRRNHS